MQKSNTFRRKLLSTAIATTLAGIASTSIAQEKPADDTEVITITGIFGSLTKSADIKRSSGGITDAITAEDMGKFPDTNLAESLQRITGVAIDRENGEGKGVTVRGLGPRYNLIQLNGRQLAAASGNRSFDFSTISSDMISGVQVHKTANAAVETGGMGATINVNTTRPLRQRGEKFVVTAKGISDRSGEDSALSPELAAIYSNTYQDGKFGVSVALSTQERNSGSNQAREGFAWFSRIGGAARDWSWWEDVNRILVNQDNHENPPDEGQIFSVPKMADYRVNNQEHNRTNAQVVLQWRPIDNFTVTADYNYYKKDLKSITNTGSIWYQWDQRSATAVWSDTPITYPLVYGEIGGGNSNNFGEVTFATEERNTTDELDAYGLNFDWTVTDDLSLKLDISGSQNSKTPNGGTMGSAARIEMAALTRRALGADYTGEIPAVYVNNPDVEASDVVPLNHWIESKYVEAEINQIKFDGQWSFADEHSLDFGVQRTAVEYGGGEKRVNRTRGHYQQFVGEFSGFDGFTEFDFLEGLNASYGDWDTTAAQLPAGGTITHSNSGESHTLTSANLYHSALRFDLEEMYSYLEDNYGGHEPSVDNALGALGPCNTVFCASNKYEQGDQQGVEETTSVAFLQWNWLSEMYEMPFDLHLGYRYEETKVDSTSAVQQFNGARWVTGNRVDLTPALRDDGAAVVAIETDDGSYNVGLPSLNFNLELTDDIVARFAYSQTISRASYGRLQGGTVLNARQRPGQGSGARGNPALEPIESENFDLSFEWYYDEGSYMSASLFKKDISNFSSDDDEAVPNVIIPGIYQPSPDGQYAQEAVAAGAVTAGEIFTWIMTNKKDAPGVEARTDRAGVVVADASRDPAMLFDISFPTNNDNVNGVNGVEIALQHMFTDTGFGFITNFTLVDTDIEYNTTTLSASSALTGVGDSANLIAFYEDDQFSVRVAYNWRDKFYNSGRQANFNEPQYTKAFASADLNMSYNITEEAQIFFQGINIFNEAKVIVGRTDDLLVSYEQTGARYVLGARYEF